MNLGDTLCQMALVVSLDLVLGVGAVLVWRALVAMRVNGPCQLSLALLLVAQLGSDLASLEKRGEAVMDWTWLLHTIFCFVFLYMLYHVGALISASRR